MTTMTLSGYLATEQEITFPGGAAQVLDALADNEWTSLSDEIDNSANKYVFADLDIVLASAAFTGADSTLEVYVVPTINGTNYPAWLENSTSDSQINQQYFAGFATTSGTTAAQRLTQLSGPNAIGPLPNGKFKFGFRSRVNVALAGSGNTVYWRTWGYAA
jgi:hypothetical protein